MLTGDGVDIGQSFPFEVNPLYVKNQEALDTPRNATLSLHSESALKEHAPAARTKDSRTSAVQTDKFATYLGIPDTDASEKAIYEDTMRQKKRDGRKVDLATFSDGGFCIRRHVRLCLPPIVPLSRPGLN